ncbi:hypothetical protein AgCh_002613 [Apium graveolens]
MAPSKSNLVKAAHEGFAMLDEFFERKRGKGLLQPQPPKQHDQYMHMYQRKPQKPHVYQVPVPAAEAKAAVTATIDCYEAAKLFNGTVIVDYPNAK